jgi:hypothetical protein
MLPGLRWNRLLLRLLLKILSVFITYVYKNVYHTVFLPMVKGFCNSVECHPSYFCENNFEVWVLCSLPKVG